MDSIDGCRLANPNLRNIIDRICHIAAKHKFCGNFCIAQSLRVRGRPIGKSHMPVSYVLKNIILHDVQYKMYILSSCYLSIVNHVSERIRET